jgi:hypothetical protein
MWKPCVSSRERSAVRPYVSVAFTNRNDGYGGDLAARIDKFIDYYAMYVRRWPGLFEFVICDWNPPPQAAKLRDAFPWEKLGDVLHVEVPPQVHARIAGSRGRPMLDYIGRNVAARRGRGDFTLIVNQDIFISESILQIVAERRLDPRCFYRADRCDFHFEPCRDVAPESFEAAALRQVFQVNRRHTSADEAISVAVTNDTLDSLGSGMEAGDRQDPIAGVIRCHGAAQRHRLDRRNLRLWRWVPPLRERLTLWHASVQGDTYYRDFLLHTNAAGDFILAPRDALFDVNGMWETTEIYLHLDSYAVLQLFAAGYEQAILLQPNRVFHADHDRSARSGFQEGANWEEHERAFSAILRGERPYRLNGKNWGLADEDLPTWRL